MKKQLDAKWLIDNYAEASEIELQKRCGNLRTLHNNLTKMRAEGIPIPHRKKFTNKVVLSKK